METAATAPPGEEIRMFSLRPALEIRGRKSTGLRAFAGKPFHLPPLLVAIAAALISPTKR
jgi:hypothetical protein